MTQPQRAEWHPTARRSAPTTKLARPAAHTARGPLWLGPRAFARRGGARGGWSSTRHLNAVAVGELAVGAARV
eukprot:3532651-Prymnesium_polylepis.1